MPSDELRPSEALSDGTNRLARPLNSCASHRILTALVAVDGHHEDPRRTTQCQVEAPGPAGASATGNHRQQSPCHPAQAAHCPDQQPEGDQGPGTGRRCHQIGAVVGDLITGRY